jgi:hypothetical protein
MAEVDVSEILTDPDLVDDIILVNRIPSINNYGEQYLKETCTASVGNVQPASGKVLNRLPEALRVANMYNFFFKGEIIASAPGKYSAQLEFRGHKFNVVTVFDWTNYGQGYCEGLCVAEVPA